MAKQFCRAVLPHVRDKIYGKEVRIVAVEPAACPTITREPFAYDFGDTAAMTPLLPMFTLGHKFLPEPIHAGGLRYHGVSPLISQLVLDKLIESQSFNQVQTYEAGLIFARTEGIVCAPETNHAIAAVIEEARKAKEEGVAKTILFNLSGHGLLDLVATILSWKESLWNIPFPSELNKSIEVLRLFPTEYFAKK